jgi:hypothetical protein
MRFLRAKLLVADFCCGVGLFEARAASRSSSIDIDPGSPTLGEMLDREAVARRPAREAEARARAEEARAREEEAQARAAAEAERLARSVPETTGTVEPRRITRDPSVPRGAVTVILPHPKTGAGRPVSTLPEKR